MAKMLTGQAIASALSKLDKLQAFDGHEMVIAVNEEEAGLHGFIALHSMALGPALGGTRWQMYNSAQSALTDALQLSKAMSYKCALAGLPWGGGKAVIIGDPKHKSKLQLHSYGQAVERLGGSFKTGTDVGVTDEDVATMAETSTNMLGVSPRDSKGMTTSSAAALGVFYALQATLKYRNGSASLRGRRIGIKGVGKLGGELARLCSLAGAKLVVADIDEDTLATVVKEIPDAQIAAPNEIHCYDLDAYAPCALGGEFTRPVIESLKTGIVVGGANNQLANDAAGESLYRAGILYAPDYVANSGGLIYVADELENDGFKAARVRRRVKQIGNTLKSIYERSDALNISPRQVADVIAREKIYGKEA